VPARTRNRAEWPKYHVLKQCPSAGNKARFMGEEKEKLKSSKHNAASIDLVTGTPRLCILPPSAFLNVMQ